jgi:hypothetical protein
VNEHFAAAGHVELVSVNHDDGTLINADAQQFGMALDEESIRFRGRSRSTPGPVISGDGRTSSVYCNLPIAPGTGRDQPL